MGSGRDLRRGTMRTRVRPQLYTDSAHTHIHTQRTLKMQPRAHTDSQRTECKGPYARQQHNIIPEEERQTENGGRGRGGERKAREGEGENESEEQGGKKMSRQIDIHVPVDRDIEGARRLDREAARQLDSD